jgi:uncharacterized protein involved in exopolysaccharide biosynthesis
MLDVAARETVFDEDSNRRSMTFSDLLGVLWRQKWCLTGAVLVSLSLGLVYLSYTEPTYNVAARVLVQPCGWPLDDGSSPRRNEEEFLATQSEIIRSPAVIERAVAATQGADQACLNNSRAQSVLGRLAARPVAGTHVLSLAYRCTDSAKGIATVGAILNSYQQFLQETERRLSAGRAPLTGSQRRKTAE